MSKGSYAEIVHPPQSHKRQGSLRRIVMGTLLSVTRQCVVTKEVVRACLLWLIDRLAERREKSLQYSLNTPYHPSNNAGWVTSSIPICPYAAGFNITQGVQQGQRVGNQIRTKCWVKGIIHPSIQDPHY